MFLDNERQVNARPLRPRELPAGRHLKNWRIDCGVAPYDNTFGLAAHFARTAWIALNGAEPETEMKL